MAREILQKTLDEGFGQDDDFDEKMLEQIEKEFQQVSSTGGATRSTQDVPGFDSSGFDSSSFGIATEEATGIDTDSFESFATETKAGFSLDDFESAIDKGSDLMDPDLMGAPSPGMPRPQPESSPAPDSGQILSAVRKKLLLLGLGGVLVLGLLVSLVVSLIPEPKPQARPVQRMIRHPLVVEPFREQLAFLVLAHAQSGNDVVTVGIELQFLCANNYEEFQKDTVTMRDVIYQFLKEGHPVKNSHKQWQQIVETGLQSHLKSTFPTSGMTGIQMVYLERM